MEIDSLKEQLGCIKNEMTHLWGTVFLLAGGSFTIIFNHRTLESFICGGFGILAAMIFGRAYIIRRVETLKIVKKIKDIKDVNN